MIDKKSGNPKKIIHANHTKSAQLIYVSGALGIVNAFFSPETYATATSLVVGLLTLAFIFGLGYLISRGNDGGKYILLILLILGIFAMPLMLVNILNNPIVGIINILQTILQIWAVLLLFRVPKAEKSETM